MISPRCLLFALLAPSAALAQAPGGDIWSEMGGKSKDTSAKTLMRELDGRAEALHFLDADGDAPLRGVQVELRYRDAETKKVGTFRGRADRRGTVMVPWKILTAAEAEFCLAAKLRGYDVLRRTISTRAGMFGVGGEGARFHLARAGGQGPEQEQCALDIVAKLTPAAKVERKAPPTPAEATKPKPRVSITVLVHFPFGKHALTAKGRTQAEEIGAAIQTMCKDSPRARFLLRGHTDSRGSKKFNRKLSKRRAQAVKAAVEAKYGKLPCKMRAEGSGENRLAVKSASAEDEHAANRRVEVIRY